VKLNEAILERMEERLGHAIKQVDHSKDLDSTVDLAAASDALCDQAMLIEEIRRLWVEREAGMREGAEAPE